jgi:hypothetical protein
MAMMANELAVFAVLTHISESMPSCKRAPEALYAFASSNRSIPSSVSKARKPSSGVLSTSGIRNEEHRLRLEPTRELLGDLFEGLCHTRAPSCGRQYEIAAGRAHATSA